MRTILGTILNIAICHIPQTIATPHYHTSYQTNSTKDYIGEAHTIVEFTTLNDQSANIPYALPWLAYLNYMRASTPKFMGKLARLRPCRESEFVHSEIRTQRRSIIKSRRRSFELSVCTARTEKSNFYRDWRCKRRWCGGGSFLYIPESFRRKFRASASIWVSLCCANVNQSWIIRDSVKSRWKRRRFWKTFLFIAAWRNNT